MAHKKIYGNAIDDVIAAWMTDAREEIAAIMADTTPWVASGWSSRQRVRVHQVENYLDTDESFDDDLSIGVVTEGNFF